MRARCLLACGLVVAFTLMAGRAAADGAEPAARAPVPPDRAPAESPVRPPEIVRAEVGVRVMHVAQPSPDAFSESGAIPFFSAQALATPLAKGRFSVALGAGYDIGVTSAKARGADASLVVHRFAVPIELRWNLAYGIVGYGRIAPGATLALASIDGTSGLEGGGWMFSADTGAGASILLGPYKDRGRYSPRVWLTPEIGYAWSAARTLHLEADRGDDPRPTGAISLGSLAFRGLTYRVALALSF